MTLDPREIANATARNGPVIRIVVAEISGSSPREAGASMLVWSDGQSGTVGGGALEWEATARARALLASGRQSDVMRLALGPALGQCCGGSVTLVAERWERGVAETLNGPAHARPLPGHESEMPLAVRRIINRARSEGAFPRASLVQGWLVEAVAPPMREIWIWGAGHVGRALATVLAPLPGIRLTWIDTSITRFPEEIPPDVRVVTAENPATQALQAPPNAEHFVLTFSHALDLEICHRLLGHGFATLGLIGSETKRARFRLRLAALGHSDAQIARIACPIGDPALGKHPQAIAVGVAAALLKDGRAAGSAQERTG